ncbi:glycosyltransferase family 9 protein [Candidatus Nomurabacteria bacterium]|nr:glycosyltransferase family 9 protein [Candidatus Nomurabacteria bacterium]
MLPDAEVTIIVRHGQEQLAQLFPPHIKWITTKIFPYIYSSEDIVELELLLDIIAVDSWDILLTTCYTRTWLDYVIAAKLINTTRYAIGTYKPIPEILIPLFNHMSLPKDQLWDHYIDVIEYSHETDKYLVLYNKLFQNQDSIETPCLDISNESKEIAKSLLDGLNLKSGEFFVCLSAGVHNVPIKCWPTDNFIELLSRIQTQTGLIPLLVGHESEKCIIDEVEIGLVSKGLMASQWLGKNGDLHLLAAIMLEARFYVGNDSGPMHIAAAIGIPTVGIFGGGYWPRFLPVGSKCVGIACKLPCFGCDWRCHLGEAPCVKAIQVEHVFDAIQAVLRGEKRDNNHIIVQAELPYDNDCHSKITSYKENSFLIDNDKTDVNYGNVNTDGNNCKTKLVGIIRKIVEKLKQF